MLRNNDYSVIIIARNYCSLGKISVYSVVFFNKKLIILKDIINNIECVTSNRYVINIRHELLSDSICNPIT